MLLPFSKQYFPSPALFFHMRDAWAKQTAAAKFHIPRKLLLLMENTSKQWATAALSGGITMKDYKHRPSAWAWGFGLLFFYFFFKLFDAAVKHNEIKGRNSQSLQGLAEMPGSMAIPMTRQGAWNLKKKKKDLTGWFMNSDSAQHKLHGQ